MCGLGLDVVGKMASMIFTIGYEGLSTETFWNLLESNQIEVLADVRALPLSRKRGFSKTPLSAHCPEYGLEYIHLRALGCPQNIRDAYKASKNWDEYTESYLAYLSSDHQAVENALDELQQLASEKRCALLCFEANPRLCHRSYVANEISARLGGTSIEHLHQDALQVLER